MSSITGENGTLKVGATPTLIVQLRSWTLERTGESPENTVCGTTDRTYLPGLRTATLGCEGFYDTADTGQAELIVGSLVDFELEPDTVGDTISGSGIVTSRSQTGANDGMVEMSYSLQVSGAVTETPIV
jgi:hypothetical protein